MTKREQFGKRLNQIRKEKGISQEELAFKAGVHRTYIGHVERADRSVSLIKIFEIAEALKIDPSELFNYKNLDEPKK